MPQDQVFPEKHLRYKICAYIADKRQRKTGLGGPLDIKISELSNLLEYAVGQNTDEKKENLRAELLALNDEMFGEKLDRPVIKILNPDILRNVSETFSDNSTLKVRCLSENLEDYVTDLKKRTQAYNRQLGRAELKPTASKAIKITLGNEEMKITRTRRHTIDLSIIIVRLMFGDPIETTGQITPIKIEEYERGDHISYKDILALIHKIEGCEESPSDISVRSIEDAVRHLNVRAMEKFERPLFEPDDEGFKWTL